MGDYTDGYEQGKQDAILAVKQLFSEYNNNGMFCDVPNEKTIIIAIENIDYIHYGRLTNRCRRNL